jgi:hypothetical protein
VQEVRIMAKKILILVTLVLLTATMAPGASREGSVITESFASPQIRPGAQWKVYINAQIADGEMNAIICKALLPGGYVCPFAKTEIKKPYRKHLSGYLFMSTAILDYLNPTNLVLIVQIMDKEGHLIAADSFPLAIDSKAQEEEPAAGVFREVSLGSIMQAYSGSILVVGADEAITKIAP